MAPIPNERLLRLQVAGAQGQDRPVGAGLHELQHSLYVLEMKEKVKPGQRENSDLHAELALSLSCADDIIAAGRSKIPAVDYLARRSDDTSRKAARRPPADGLRA